MDSTPLMKFHPLFISYCLYLQNTTHATMSSPIPVFTQKCHRKLHRRLCWIFMASVVSPNLVDSYPNLEMNELTLEEENKVLWGETHLLCPQSPKVRLWTLTCGGIQGGCNCKVQIYVTIHWGFRLRPESVDFVCRTPCRLAWSQESESVSFM